MARTTSAGDWSTYTALRRASRAAKSLSSARKTISGGVPVEAWASMACTSPSKTARGALVSPKYSFNCVPSSMSPPASKR